MTRSLLRPIRTRRIVHSGTPLTSKTNSANSITPGTRKTLAAIGALWVSFAVSASATASAKPVPGQKNLAPTSSASEERVSPGRDQDGVERHADSHAPWVEEGEPDHRRSVPGATPAISGRPSRTEAKGIVFITTGKRADASVACLPTPEPRHLPADASTALGYLKSLSK